LLATSIIKPLNSAICVHGASLVAYSKVKHCLTGGVYLVDTAVLLARGARDARTVNEDRVGVLAHSGGNFEAEAAMGHGGITKGHGNAAVISDAFAVGLTSLASGERFARRGATSAIREAGVVAAVLFFCGGRASVANTLDATV
jgi:hypothetical protein